MEQVPGTGPQVPPHPQTLHPATEGAREQVEKTEPAGKAADEAATDRSAATMDEAATDTAATNNKKPSAAVDTAADTEADKAVTEKAAADKAAADKAKAAAETAQAAEKVAADTAADTEAAADKAATDAIAEKAAAHKAVAHKAGSRASRGRQLSEAPDTVTDPTGTSGNTTLGKHQIPSSVAVAYGLPTLINPSSAQGGQLFAGAFLIQTGVLLQGNFVQYRPQRESPPQKAVFFAACFFPRNQAGSRSHQTLTAFMCATTGEAFKTQPALTKLTRLNEPPVQLKSRLWGRYVKSQKEHIKTLAAEGMAATKAWDESKKREEARRQQKATARMAKLEQLRRDNELADEKAARAQDAQEHERVQAELSSLKRQLSEKTDELSRLKRARTRPAQDPQPEASFETPRVALSSASFPLIPFLIPQLCLSKCWPRREMGRGATA